MKIIDCFMYFDEDMMLDIRLNVLNKFVSHFVICEAAFNHKGISKKLNFNINNFSKFKNKISYVVADKQPDNLRKINKNDDENRRNSKILDNALIRENYQRNYLTNKLKKFSDDDLIIINDLDEIPNLDKPTISKKPIKPPKIEDNNVHINCSFGKPGTAEQPPLSRQVIIESIEFKID